MARVFLTGSADGLGRLAARLLVKEGHEVVLHGRNAKRAADALEGVPGAAGALAADLANGNEVRQLAAEANASGRFDAVIHNAGVYRASSADILAVNLIAPYLLTCLMSRPQRLIYLASNDHFHGNADVAGVLQKSRTSYTDSKLWIVMLAKAVSRRWPDLYVNSVDPGWVPTKMGGAGAPDDLDKGAQTQAWLAVSDDAGARVSGRYFYHRHAVAARPEADREGLQDALLSACEGVTGETLPA